MLVRKSVEKFPLGYELVVYENQSTKKMEANLHLNAGGPVTTIAHEVGDTEDEARRQIAVQLHLLAERVFPGRA